MTKLVSKFPYHMLDDIQYMELKMMEELTSQQEDFLLEEGRERDYENKMEEENEIPEETEEESEESEEPSEEE